jgi:hypothetical protein
MEEFMNSGVMCGARCTPAFSTLPSPFAGPGGAHPYYQEGLRFNGQNLPALEDHLVSQSDHVLILAPLVFSQLQSSVKYKSFEQVEAPCDGGTRNSHLSGADEIIAERVND